MYVVYSRKEPSCMLNVPFEKMSFRCCSVRLQGWWIGLSWSVFGSQADGSGGASHVAYWAEPMVVLGGLLSHLPRSRKKTFNWARCAMISCRCQRWKSTVFHRFIGSFSTPFDNWYCVTCKKKAHFHMIWPFLPPGTAEICWWHLLAWHPGMWHLVLTPRQEIWALQEEILQWNGYHGTWRVVSIGSCDAGHGRMMCCGNKNQRHEKFRACLGDAGNLEFSQCPTQVLQFDAFLNQLQRSKGSRFFVLQISAPSKGRSAQIWK